MAGLSDDPRDELWPLWPSFVWKSDAIWLAVELEVAVEVLALLLLSAW